MNRPGLAHEVRARVDALADVLVAVSHEIHAHPELAFAEHRAAALLAGVAGAAGLDVERGAFGLPTAFRADAGPSRARVVVCCEYDALPSLGHACGHNVIAAAGLGAGLALAPIARRLGRGLRLLGTPAEEGGGGKILLLRRGAFDGAAAVLLTHPGDGDVVLPPIRAAARIAVTCFGRPAHAALSPHRGRNALDALVLGYQAAGALRGVLPPGDQVHGTITDGGGPPNVVPARAAATFIVRSVDADGLARALDRTAACFTGAAAATGCRASMKLAGPVYRELRPDPTLARAYHRHLLTLGRSPLPLGAPGRSVPGGSTDLGNVSQEVPAIHPKLAIAPAGVATHTPAFARYAVGPAADRAVLDGAKAMALTALDVWAARSPGAQLSGLTRPAPSRYRPIRRGHRS
jgi:amidohydrolase